MLYWGILLLWNLSYTQIQASCPGNGDKFNNICYWSIDKLHNFEDANHACTGNGGHLAGISNEDIFSFLLQKKQDWGLTSSSVWIGLHDKYKKREYVNMLNETQSQFKWKTNEPNTAPGRHCVTMEHDDGLWATHPCHDKRPAFCSSQEMTTFQNIYVYYSQTTTTATSQVETQNANTQTSEEIFSQSSTSLVETKVTNTDLQTTTMTTTQVEACECPCKTYLAENTKELHQKIKSLQAKLKINKAKLSSGIRSKTSASDNRTTSAFIGTAFGIGFIVTFVLSIVISDVSILIKHIKGGLM